MSDEQLRDNAVVPDPRYHFQGFEADLLVGLGRLTLSSSYVEGSAAVLLARLLDNSDLDIGFRITANSTFPWILDHARALAERRLSTAQHAEVVDWCRRATAAYARRSRIVHAMWGVSVGNDSQLAWFFERSNVRGKTFEKTQWDATAEHVHEVAQELEQVGLQVRPLLNYAIRASIGSKG